MSSILGFIINIMIIMIMLPMLFEMIENMNNMLHNIHKHVQHNTGINWDTIINGIVSFLPLILTIFL